MRCFLAIELPREVLQRLVALQEELQSVRREVRWTRPEHIHLTLKFFGEVADGDLPEVHNVARAIAARVEPIDLEVRGAGCFPPGGPVRIVWAGVVGPPPVLVECWQACEHGFAELGFKPEQRDYRPHLTIGRVRNARASQQIRSAVDQQDSFSGGQFVAEGLTLFQSVLSRSGPTYTALARMPFSG